MYNTEMSETFDIIYLSCRSMFVNLPANNSIYLFSEKMRVSAGNRLPLDVPNDSGCVLSNPAAMKCFLAGKSFSFDEN